MKDPDEDDNDLGLSLSTGKTTHKFEEGLDTLQQLYIRESCRIKRQMQLFETREEMQHSDNSTFTPVRPHGEGNFI